MYSRRPQLAPRIMKMAATMEMIASARGTKHCIGPEIGFFDIHARTSGLLMVKILIRKKDAPKKSMIHASMVIESGRSFPDWFPARSTFLNSIFALRLTAGCQKIE